MDHTEYIKIKLPRSTISRLKDISAIYDIPFDEFVNTVIKDGMNINQPDFILRNEFIKFSTLRAKMAVIYAFFGKNVPTFDTSSGKTELLGHIFVDFSHFYRKKKLTEFELLGLTKLKDVFIYAKNNYPGEFLEFKLSLTLDHKNKVYKHLFGSLGIPNSKTDHVSVSSYNTNSVTESEIDDLNEKAWIEKT